LAEPDPEFGFYNGELRFWLGWAQRVAGDYAAAQQSWQQTRTELEPLLKEQPQNAELISVRADQHGPRRQTGRTGSCRAGDGREAGDKDVVNGPFALEILARVAAQPGRPTGHRRFTETPLDLVLWRIHHYAAHSRTAPARSNVRSLRGGPRFQNSAKESSPSRPNKFNHGFETRSAPASLAAAHRGFPFCVARPTRFARG